MGALIAGIVRHQTQAPDRPALDRLIDAVHREASIHGFHQTRCGLAAGVLDPGGQTSRPTEQVAFENDAITLVADCRVDNVEALARDLHIAKDTPVAALLAAAWSRWGVGMADRVHGDFAIAVWDTARECLTLIRDIMGVRPLFYTARTPGQIAFCSLSAPLVQSRLAADTPDLAVIDRMARMNHGAEARTGLAEIRRVRPGHFVQITPNGLTETRYWQLTCRDPIPASADYDHAVRALRDRIATAVQRRLPPGTGPIASHLSGGIDSSLIAVMAARAAPERTVLGYGILPERRSGDPDTVDAAPFVQAVAQREPNLQPRFVDALSVDAYSDVPLALDMPVPVTDRHPHRAIPEQAAAEGAGIILTGLGGDQLTSYSGKGALTEWLLTGRWKTAFAEARHTAGKLGRSVPWVFAGDIARRIVPHAWNGWLAKRLGRKYLHAATMFRPFLKGRKPVADWGQTGVTTRDVRLKLAGTDGLLPLDAEIYATFAARHGMTCAHPLLDRDVMEYAIRLPTSFLRRHGGERAAMKAAAADLLPDMVLNPTSRRLDDATMVLRATEARKQFSGAVQRVRNSGAESPIDLDAVDRALAELPDIQTHRARMRDKALAGEQTGETEIAYLYPLLLARFAARDKGH